MQGIELPEMRPDPDASPCAGDWENDSVSRYRAMSHWIQKNMGVQDGPSASQEEEKELHTLLISTLHAEASSRVSEACSHLTSSCKT